MSCLSTAFRPRADCRSRRLDVLGDFVQRRMVVEYVDPFMQAVPVVDHHQKIDTEYRVQAELLERNIIFDLCSITIENVCQVLAELVTNTG